MLAFVSVPCARVRACVWQVIGDPVIATIPAPKHRVLVLDCSSRDLMTSLHFAKCSDVVVIVINVAQGEDYTYDDQGSAFLTAFKAQGMPTVVGLVQGLDLAPPKRQSDLKRFAHKCVCSFSLQALLWC
jgi:hypothetical protein